MVNKPYIIPITGGDAMTLENMNFQERPYSSKAERTTSKYTASTIVHIKNYKTEAKRIKEKCHAEVLIHNQSLSSNSQLDGDKTNAKQAAARVST